MVDASFREEFLRYSVDRGVLRFGEFTTKAGRQSPYFFNAGLFDHGVSLGRLADFYARALLGSGVEFDMLFGPAYKGIALAACTAVALAAHGRDVGFAYNRKEAKDHGEGGILVGAPLKGRVVIIDDVISAGTSVRESVALIRAAGAQAAAVLVALDRQERSGPDHVLSAGSAAQQVQLEFGIPVVSIACLDDMLALAARESGGIFAQHQGRIQAYRERYGARA
jgi:orotate phosphoribosyltransferase